MVANICATIWLRKYLSGFLNNILLQMLRRPFFTAEVRGGILLDETNMRSQSVSPKARLRSLPFDLGQLSNI
jgi:hypothetical protein